MANTNKPFGLSPQRTLAGSKFNEGGTRYYIASTDTSAYYIGDLVNAAKAADTNGVPSVGVSAGTGQARGVIVGVEVANVQGVSIAGPSLLLENTNVPATKTRDYYVYVNDDPMTLFAVQGDSTATNQTAANANQNATFTVAAPSNAVQPSATVVNSSTIASTSTLTGKLVGLLQIPNNGFGAYAVWQCKLNVHDFGSVGTPGQA
jgi:hypothetical protein